MNSSSSHTFDTLYNSEMYKNQKNERNSSDRSLVKIKESNEHLTRDLILKDSMDDNNKIFRHGRKEISKWDWCSKPILELARSPLSP